MLYLRWECGGRERGVGGSFHTGELSYWSTSLESHCTVLSAYDKEKSFRNLELVNIFYFLCKPGNYGKLYRIHESFWSLLTSLISSCVAFDKLLNFSVPLFFPSICEMT